MIRRRRIPFRDAPRSVRGAVLLAAMTATASLATAADLPQLPRYFAELRNRRLFEVAERYALNELESSSLAPAVRAQLVIELSQTYAQHARFAESAADGEDLSQRADEVLRSLLESAPTFPRRDAVRFQQLRLAAEEADSLHWRAQLEPEDTIRRSAAAAAITYSIAALTGWVADVAKQRAENPRRASSENPDGELTAREWNQMRREAELRIVELSLSLSEVASSPADRAAAVVSAQTRLDELNRGALDPAWETAIKLARLRLLRLQGDTRKLQALARPLLADPSAAANRNAVVAELVRSELQNRQYDAAVRLLSDHAGKESPPSDELRTLRIEALLGQWAAAPDDARDALWKAAAEERSQVAGEWEHRARSLVEQAETVRQFGVEAASLVRRGRAAYRSKDRARAADIYAEAAAAARSSNHAAAAEELEFTRASILVEDQQYAAAIEACERLVASRSSSRRAAEASLLAIYSRGQLVRQAASNEHSKGYEDALSRHLEQFAGDSTGDEVRWLLGTWHEGNGRPRQAIDVLSRISPAHARAAASSSRRARIYQQVIEEGRAGQREVDGRSQADWNREALAVFEQVAAGWPAAPARLDAGQAATAIAYGRVLLLQDSPRYREADAFFDRVIRSAEIVRREGGPAAGWTPLLDEAQALRIVSLSGEKQFEAANAILVGLPAEPAEPLLRVLLELANLLETLPEDQQLGLGRLELAAIDRLRNYRESFPAADRRRFDEIEAAALAAADRTSEAIPKLEAMVAERPKEGALLRRLATFLERRGRPEDFAKARARWQELERLSRPGSRDWLEARYDVARCLVEEGKAEEARKLIKATGIVYPAFGGDDLKDRFEELARAAEAGSKSPDAKTR